MNFGIFFSLLLVPLLILALAYYCFIVTREDEEESYVSIGDREEVEVQ
ncbi:hypothetical protein [Ammoniphilus sp. YIM 78166]|nr:hypothetical protein [Ammoniphilus sp. YIM 78166]